MNLSANQLAQLQRLRNAHFEIVAFPMYSNHIGIRKGNCAALLAPSPPSDTFTLFGAPSYLIAGNLAVKFQRNSRQLFVWKKTQLEVTPERQSELDAFARELAALLESR